MLFSAFEYSLWVTVICKYFSRRNTKRRDVNVIAYMKSETDVKCEFAKVIPVSTVTPKSGQADKIFSLLQREMSLGSNVSCNA